MLQPAKSTTILQPGHFYGLDKMDSQWLTRAAYAIYRVGGKFVNIERQKGQFECQMSDTDVFLSYRGLLHDNALPAKYIDEDYEQNTVFVLPSATSAIRLFEGDKLNSGYTWYLGGVTAGDIDVLSMFSLEAAMDSERPTYSMAGSQSEQFQQPTFTAPALDAPPPKVAEKIFVPEPTEAELLEALKTRVPSSVSVLCDVIQKTIADGVIKNLATVLMKCSDPVVPSGYSRADWCRTFFGNLKEMMSGVGVADALRPVLMKSRMATANSIAALFKQLIPYTDYEDNRRILSEYAIRAQNLSYAMGMNPALSSAELLSIDPMVPTTLLDTLDGISTAAVEYGLSLDSFAPRSTTKNMHQTVVDGSNKMKKLMSEGWVVAGNQGKVQVGSIAMFKQEIKTSQGLAAETIFAPELFPKLAADAALLLEKVLYKSSMIPEPKVEQDKPKIAAQLASDENDCLIGREPGASVAGFRKEILDAAGDVEDFQALQAQSGGEQSLPLQQLSGIEPKLIASVMVEQPTVLPTESVEQPMWPPLGTQPMPVIRSVSFEDVE